MAAPMAKVDLILKMEKSVLKVSSKTVFLMEKEQSIERMEVFCTLDLLNKMSILVKEPFTDKMGPYISKV